MIPTNGELLPRVTNRQDLFDYLDGHSVESADGLAERHLEGPLVKSFMLETVPGSQELPPIEEIFLLNGLRVERLDDEVGLLYQPEDERPFGLVEQVDRRHPVISTTLKSTAAAAAINRVVRSNPWLDRLWLSAPILEQLWQRVKETSHPNQYTRLKFDHDAFYEEAANDGDIVDEELLADVERDDEADEKIGSERRASSFTMVERVSILSQMLPELQDLYRPFESLVQIRIPGQSRGGHDFYFDGQVTNRSDSFFDHRAAIHRVVDLYRRTTDASEQVLWLGAADAEPGLYGAALTFRFSEELSQSTFERWLESTFTRHGRFRLSGRRFPISPTREQVAAIDRHLWQPLQMEVSTRGMVVLLPAGTCGNTVHRLTTNIQRFLDPGVEVWLGETSYATLIESSMRAVA